MSLVAGLAVRMRQAVGMNQGIGNQPVGTSVARVAVHVDLQAARSIVVRCGLCLIRIVVVGVMTEVRRIRGGLLVRAIGRSHSPGGLQREEAQQDDGDKPTHEARFYGQTEGHRDVVVWNRPQHP